MIRAGVATLLLVIGCGTKANPSATCPDGNCHDPSYPYCDVDGAIGGEPNTCIAVICSPGAFGACDGTNTALYCNAQGDGYDPMSCPFGCDASTSTCRSTCSMNSQCATGICKSDGTCALDSEIAYTDPAGSSSSDCSKASPCTLEHALSLIPPPTGQFVKLTAGEYEDASTLTVSGKRWLIGDSASTTAIHNMTMGPIFTLAVASDVTFQQLRISLATGPQQGQPYAYGIECPMTPSGPRRLTVLDSIVADNARENVYALYCDVTLVRSVFSGGYSGAVISGGTAGIDRSTFANNANYGLLANGTLNITNSFFTRNSVGIELQAVGTSVFDFNTVVDNSMAGVGCVLATTAKNNIIVRNQINVDSSSPCTFPGSIIQVDVAGLDFVAADTAPYDYHLGSHSIAIDAATSDATLDHDYDGDARPKGNGRDVGADEAF